MTGARLVLASASPARRALLEAAGLVFKVEPAEVDETALKKAHAGAHAADLAALLADAKAVAVSKRHPGALVIGADQVLAVDDDLLDKPADRAAAAASLERLQGRAHRLISAVALARDGEVRWRHAETARLVMRPLADAAIAGYLEAAGDDVLASVGAYRLEGLGVRLFERVEGDYFTILGLPLLALLAELRRAGAIAD